MLFRHVLRNAMIPILTGVVVVIPLLFMGSLLTESFFGIPGLGSYTIDAIGAQDFRRRARHGLHRLGALHRRPDPHRHLLHAGRSTDQVSNDDFPCKSPRSPSCTMHSLLWSDLGDLAAAAGSPRPVVRRADLAAGGGRDWARRPVVAQPALACGLAAGRAQPTGNGGGDGADGLSCWSACSTRCTTGRGAGKRGGPAGGLRHRSAVAARCAGRRRCARATRKPIPSRWQRAPTPRNRSKHAMPMA